MTVETVRDRYPTESATTTLTLLRMAIKSPSRRPRKHTFQITCLPINAYLNLRDTTLSADRSEMIIRVWSRWKGGSGGVILDLRQMEAVVSQVLGTRQTFWGREAGQTDHVLHQQSQGFDYRFGVYGSNLGPDPNNL